MCVTVETSEKDFFCFDRENYEKEVALFRRRMNALLNKVEQNENIKIFDKGNNYKEFKESLKNINHENLKK